MSSRSPTESNSLVYVHTQSFPPRVVSVDGNKVKKKKNCNNNGDSYAGISFLFFFFGFTLREFLQSD